MTFVCIKTIVVNQIDTSFNLSQRHVKPGGKRTKIKKNTNFADDDCEKKRVKGNQNKHK